MVGNPNSYTTIYKWIIYITQWPDHHWSYIASWPGRIPVVSTQTSPPAARHGYHLSHNYFTPLGVGSEPQLFFLIRSLECNNEGAGNLWNCHIWYTIYNYIGRKYINIYYDIYIYLYLSYIYIYIYDMHIYIYVFFEAWATKTIWGFEKHNNSVYIYGFPQLHSQRQHGCPTSLSTFL